MRQLSVEEIQNWCLYILKEFDAFCHKNNLKYYLIGGSALGAVRHNGFIPWDDDVDVGMFREDYERFCFLYKDSDEFQLLTLERAANYFNPFAKLCYTKSSFNEPMAKSTYAGIFIDIFPLDYVDDSRMKMKRGMLKKRLYNYCFCSNFQQKQIDSQIHEKTSKVKLALKKLGSLWYRGHNYKTVAKSVNASIVSKQPTSQVMNVWGAHNEKEISPVQWFAEGELHTFCDMKCLIPSNWDLYLTKMYGDYMQLPKNQTPHHGLAFVDD